MTLNSAARSFGNLITLGTLHVTPRSAAVDAFLSYARQHHPLMAQLIIRVHADEASALRYILDNQSKERTWALIVFYSLPLGPLGPLGRAELANASNSAAALHSASSTSSTTPAPSAATTRSRFMMSPPALRYAIRLNYSTVPNTNFIRNFLGVRGLDSRYQRYYFSGFVTLQALVDDYAFAALAPPNAAVDKTHPSTVESRVSLSTPVGMPFPTAAYSQNIFYEAVGFLLGLVMCIYVCIYMHMHIHIHMHIHPGGLPPWAGDVHVLATASGDVHKSDRRGEGASAEADA